MKYRVLQSNEKQLSVNLCGYILYYIYIQIDDDKYLKAYIFSA